MEKKITEKYLDILSRFEKLTNEKNNPDITKLKKKCNTLYEEVLKYIMDGSMKKTEIDCFNWFEIVIRIFENEKDAYLSKIMFNHENNKKNKISKDYVITQNKKRIYKIISKPIDYINETIDCNYDPHYCILDQIDIFYSDAQNMDHFPYKKDTTELCMIFIDTPCNEIIDEAKNKNILCIGMNELPLKNLDNYNCIILDINVIIALCSDINFLDPSSEYIQKLIDNKIFVGFNTDNTSKMTCDEYCKYVKKEYNYLINEIQKYKKAVVCNSAYNEAVKILCVCGTETEKNRLPTVMKDLNIELIDESLYKCEKISNDSKKNYKQVEKDVIISGYVLNATIFTSNHRYIDFLISKNIFIESIISSSLNLICQISKEKFRK